MIADLDPVRIELAIAPTAGGPVESCVVVTKRVSGSRSVELVLDSQQKFVATSKTDFEEALQALRTQLESAGLLLQCNRFRRNAFVSSMSRGMSDGLACYLVEPGKGVEPEHVEQCLAAAPGYAVVSAVTDAYINEWIEQGPTKVWLVRMWWKRRREHRQGQLVRVGRYTDDYAHSGWPSRPFLMVATGQTP